jgi:hypothetical protein
MLGDVLNRPSPVQSQDKNVSRGYPIVIVLSQEQFTTTSLNVSHVRIIGVLISP